MARLLYADGLGHHAPRFWIFNYHSQADNVVPYAQDAALVGYYCSRGTPVDHVILTGDHITVGEARPSLVPPWLARLFSGAPLTDTCP